MESHHTKWWIGVAAVAVLLGGWMLLGGDDPDGDLREGPTQVRLDAIVRLETRGDAKAARTLEQYRQDKDTQVAVRSLYALGKSDHSETATIAEAMRDSREEVREAAVVAIGMRGENGDPATLRNVLSNLNETANVRAAAAAQLGAMYDWQAMPMLVAGLESEDVAMRAASYRAIRQMIQADVGFDPDAPRELRAPVVARLKREWPGYKAIYDSFQLYRKVKRQ